MRLSTVAVFILLMHILALPALGASGKKPLSRLRATAASDAMAISLQWKRSKSLTGAIVIQRSLRQSSGFQSIKKVNAKFRSYRDTADLASGTIYFYRLRARALRGKAALSNVAFAKTAGSEPVPLELIPAERRVDWSVGTAVGVPGGIPTDRTSIIDVTLPPYNADKTGATNAHAAIQAAINDARPKEVVYLPAGTYRIDATILVGPQNGGRNQDEITLRGAGMDATIIDCRASRCLEGGWENDYRWNYPSSGNLVTAGLDKGSTKLTIADTSAFEVGKIIQITFEDDITLPVVHVGAYPNARRQKSRVIEKTASTLTIYPPLYGDHQTVNARVYTGTKHLSYFGIEDLTIDSKNGTTTFGILFWETYASWIKNVKVKNASNYSVYIADSLNFEMRRSYLDKLSHEGSNGAGLLFEGSCGSLIEDNIFYKSFPHIEINFGSAGNVFAYNFAEGNEVFGVMGVSIDSNHGPHNAFNLFEGNVASVFESDGYFGSESDGTLFRNWFHATNDTTDQFGRAVQLNRFTRNYSIVGNLLGRLGTDPSTQKPLSYVYSNQASNGVWGGGSYGIRLVYALGLPNIGNLGFNGKYVQPSIGNYWSDWERFLAAAPGQGPGAGGFQELDLDVIGTTIIKGNWNAADGAIRASESLPAGIELGDSMYLRGKPEWFRSLKWPPFDPANPNLSYDAIPAGYRFVHGQDPPL